MNKYWLCQHSSFKKAPTSKKDAGCKTFIDVRFKKINKDTIRNDIFLKPPEPLSCIIKINLVHTHSTENADVLRRLSVTPEVRIIIFMFL